MVPILLSMAMARQGTQTPPAPQPVLVRHLVYSMTGTNKDRETTTRYQAQANGDEFLDSKNRLFDSFAWTNVVENGKPVQLSPESSSFRQILTLDPGYRAPYPDLTKVQPILIGPITDLMTFFVDARLAMALNLPGVGARMLVRYGQPASWADGSRVLIGQDAIDFDVKLKAVNRRTNVLTILVRHVPPTTSSLKFPADWMNAPVTEGPNNWVQVVKTSDGKFVAGVGKETFDVEVNVGLIDGHIVSATEDNVVEVSERVCNDDKLTDPGKSVRYRIVRHIEIRQ